MTPPVFLCTTAFLFRAVERSPLSAHKPLPAPLRPRGVFFPFFAQVVALRSVHPKFLFGSGKAAEMSGVVSAADADAVFVNAPLSGQQQKALATKWGGTNVLDRFRVILDIFADRARTNEAKLQARGPAECRVWAAASVNDVHQQWC